MSHLSAATVRRVPIPRCRDPFVNTPLLPLAPAADGRRRWWCSTYNSVQGCQGVVLDEAGACRVYPFHDPPHFGFYSAVATAPDTLWLCGQLSTLVRLDLTTGAYTAHGTDAPPALVFQGMIHDPATGKLFALAFPPAVGPTAFSYDRLAGRPAKVYRNLCQDRYARCSIPNGDGTWTLFVTVPGLTAIHWDPVREEATATRLLPTLDSHGRCAVYSVIRNDAGHAFVPGVGWYDPRARRVVATTPAPARDFDWCLRRGDDAWGYTRESGGLLVARWHLPTGEVTDVARLTEAAELHLDPAAGEIALITTPGEFRRHDLATGALRLARRLPVTGIQHTDRLQRIDGDRLLGTPFISQRFWEVNLATGQGGDCGRAAPGGGEILHTWRLGGKIFMASYASGALVEYDPAEHPHYLENPRVVAAPAHAMRPVGGADDGGSVLWYACSRPYGQLGGVLVRYDTTTGTTRLAEDPLGPRQVISLGWDAARRRLLAGSSFHADCQSATPQVTTCVFAAFDGETLAVRGQVAAPPGVTYAAIVARLADGRWLVYLRDGKPLFGLLTLGADDALSLAPLPTPFEACSDFCAAGPPGWLAVLQDGQVTLWHLPDCTPHPVAAPWPVHGVRADATSLYLIGKDELVAMDGLWSAPEA